MTAPDQPAADQTAADQAAPSEPTMNPLTVEFCGETHHVQAPAGFSIGRESDLIIDDNPYLHRRFLRIHAEFGLWWLANVGSLLSATVTDATGQVQAWLSPGAKLPIVFPQMHVLFTAGSTTYDFTIRAEDDFYNTTAVLDGVSGSTTMMPVALTSSQRLLVVALAENILTQAVPGRGSIPSSAQAADRLGWSMTTFNRKLDNVCDKLDKIGVGGLGGGRGALATHRRARLVEYAITTHLVSADDLVLLEPDSRVSVKP